jgi:hypothetical protein
MSRETLSYRPLERGRELRLRRAIAEVLRESGLDRRKAQEISDAIYALVLEIVRREVHR